MPIGAGFAGVGVSVAGHGSVDAAIAPDQAILIDGDGQAQAARMIDPATGQYSYSPTGRVLGMDGVQQLVLLRAATLLNSSAIVGLGLSAASGVVGVNIERRLTEEINEAMRDLVDGGLIQIVRVEVVREPGTSSFKRVFTWRDLTAGSNRAGSEQRTNF